MSDTEALRRSLLVKFRNLTQERLVRLNNAFLLLEEKADNPSLAAELLREVHTLKGEAKMMGFASINAVAHQTEDLLLWARSRDFRIPREISRLVLAGFDLIAVLLDQDPSAVSQQAVERFTAQATAALRNEPAPAASLHPSQPESGMVEPQPGGRQADRAPVYVRHQRLDQVTDLTGDLILGQGRTEFYTRTLSGLLNTWRRDLNQIKPWLRALPDRGGLNVVMQRMDDLDKVARVLTQCTDELFAQRVRLQNLEERVREIRLVQLSTLLSRFPRAARDLAGEQGKQVHVHIDGADVAVDSDVLEKLSEPLLHLVRNCVDHGIEAPAQRLRVGKPEVGTITLSASLRGGSVMIAVGDDGMGIDAKRVAETAVAQGMMSAQQARNLAPEELHALLFRSGFSTRSTVTDVSGRGVGLDIVRQEVLHLGGSVDVQTRPGRGTAFRITVPVSMVLSRALVMRLGKHYLAVPSEAVHSARLVPMDEMMHTSRNKVLRVDDTLVAVGELAKILRLPADGPRHKEAEAVLILAHQGQVRALIVDAFLGERQVVQRKLDAFCDGLHVLHGTAVLGNGQLALMLNVPELMHAGASQLPDENSAQTGVRFTGQVLLVDDSEVSRDALVSFLKSHGWRVREAVNGADALSKAELERPDVIITDLDMPVLDGLGLLRGLRERRPLQEVPVLVLTQRDAPQEEAQARGLGAYGCLRKPGLDPDKLLLTLQRLLQPRGA